MKEEIDQTELEEMEKEVEKYFSRYKVPPPTEKKVDETINAIKVMMEEQKKPAKQSAFHHLWNEIKNINKPMMMLQMLILCSTIFVLSEFSQRAILGFIFCITPLSMVLALTECLKNRTNQVSELEMTFKYGTGQLFLYRFVSATVLHFITVAPMIILIGMVEVDFFTSLLIAWLLPSLTVSVLFLGISFYLPSKFTVAPIIIVAWLSCSILLTLQQQALLTWISLPMAIHLVTLLLLVFSLYKIITNYLEDYKNGVTSSIY